MASVVMSSSHNEHYRGENLSASSSYVRNYANAPNYTSNFRTLTPNPNPYFSTRSPTLQQIRRPHTRVVHRNATASSPRSAPPAQLATPPGGTRRCLTSHLGSYSNRELKHLKKRLISELDRVRSLRTRIESLSEPAFQNPAPPPPPVGPKKKKHVSKGSTKLDPASALLTEPAFQNLVQSPPPVGPKKKEHVSKAPTKLDQASALLKASMMKKCGQMLAKLMNYKHGWVFNKPVDVVSLGLHDYHSVIRNPMNLGTVKSKLGKEEYRTPPDFAADVKLTFNNAMFYNPKGQDVYLMAQDMLFRFENLFNPAFKKYESDVLLAKQGLKKGKTNTPSLPVGALALRDSAKIGKKPKVRPKKNVGPVENLRRRDFKEKSMSFEEKSRLAMGLQELPQDKLDEMVQIIKKRNLHLAPGSDEVEMELDIEAIDNETLWELDRLVRNNQHMVSSGMARLEEIEVE